ncbi:hypothetical protein LTR72_008939 [Exophiala xenobiotica]|nr:hypothetical protein LTR72_008939 [Exophiala xenobiotica]KAK5289987.1 hypothetical protein LTR14_007005 [Exophiala xenobiotica]KAK5369428.1 hypothetical protein LTS13_007149 [Exophiala xenobiotica]KAK5394687.1 hypothetical protein LTR79_008140 [Exophiala xenobiotica]KAK5409734.1 hypothetical protein LTR90_008925 [Exophiala xenobiotica]
MDPCERIQILNLEVDSEDISYYRILLDGKSFKYITIDAGVYDPEVMTWSTMLVPRLPPLPEGDWNEGHITNHPDQRTPYFSRYAKVRLPTIVSTWSAVQIDWLDLEHSQRIRSNIQIMRFKKEIAGMRAGQEVLVKFARFPWEIQYFEHETRIYERLDKQKGIAPQFLGHLTEGGRAMGLVIEYIKDARHADPEDFDECHKALKNFHLLGLLHGDVNRHNFLVREADEADGGRRKTATIIDLECAEECTDAEAFEHEMNLLLDELYSTDGKGGCRTERDDEGR